MKRTEVPLALLIIASAALLFGFGADIAFTFGTRTLAHAAIFTGAAFLLAGSLLAWFWKG